jgi:hypothetical protein
MAFIPIPNAIKASLEFTYGGQTIVLTLGWVKASAVQHNDLEDLAGALSDWMDSDLDLNMNSGVSLFNINATDQSSESGESYDLAISPNLPGTLNTGGQPANVAAVCTFRTPLRGRSYRGRAYLGGLDSSQISNATRLTTNAASAIVNAFSGLVDVGTPLSLVHAVFSRFHNGTPRTVGVATEVTQYTIDTAIDSQRRRLYGRGI